VVNCADPGDIGEDRAYLALSIRVAMILVASFTHLGMLKSAMLSLASIYGGTQFLTELISHSTAVSLLFPIALGTAQSLGIDGHPLLDTRDADDPTRLSAGSPLRSSRR